MLGVEGGSGKVILAVCYLEWRCVATKWWLRGFLLAGRLDWHAVVFWLSMAVEIKALGLVFGFEDFLAECFTE